MGSTVVLCSLVMLIYLRPVHFVVDLNKYNILNSKQRNNNDSRQLQFTTYIIGII